MKQSFCPIKFRCFKYVDICYFNKNENRFRIEVPANLLGEKKYCAFREVLQIQ